MNATRRALVSALAVTLPSFAIAGGLSRLAESVTGRRPLATIHMVLLDQSSSVQADDAALYRKAFASLCATLSPGDRVILGAIAERTIASFVPHADRSAERKGIALDDREAVAKLRKDLDGDFITLLSPVKAARQTYILDALNAASEVLSTAKQDRKRLLLLSDGLEESREANFARSTIAGSFTKGFIEQRRRKGLLPQLKDVEVLLVGLGGKSNTQYAALRTFWTDYLAAAGASPVYVGRAIPDTR